MLALGSPRGEDALMVPRDQNVNERGFKTPIATNVRLPPPGRTLLRRGLRGGRGSAGGLRALRIESRPVHDGRGEDQLLRRKYRPVVR